MSVFAWFASRVPQATSAPPPEVERQGPPPRLLPFYWHFVRQARGLFAATFATAPAVALIDLLIPVFIGRLVGLMAAEDRAAAFATPGRRGVPARRRNGARPPPSTCLRSDTPPASRAGAAPSRRCGRWPAAPGR
jgi:hypothetical protein